MPGFVATSVNQLSSSGNVDVVAIGGAIGGGLLLLFLVSATLGFLAWRSRQTGTSESHILHSSTSESVVVYG